MAYLDNGGVTHLWRKIKNAISHGAPAHNLLDNSDFTNPVNQRGQTSYSGTVYTIDRWKLWSTNSKASLITDGNIVAINPNGDDLVSLSQRFPKGFLRDEKAYTFAYLDTQGTIHIDNNPVVRVLDDCDYVEIKNSAWTGLIWAALYEGTYTADTLPPYMPKGYAAELAECQRYFYKVPSVSTVNYVGYASRATNARITIPTPVPMRVTPTLTVNAVSDMQVYDKDGAKSVTGASVSDKDGNAVTIDLTTSGLTAWTVCSARFHTDVTLSADL